MIDYSNLSFIQRGCAANSPEFCDLINFALCKSNKTYSCSCDICITDKCNYAISYLDLTFTKTTSATIQIKSISSKLNTHLVQEFNNLKIFMIFMSCYMIYLNYIW